MISNLTSAIMGILWKFVADISFDLCLYTVGIYVYIQYISYTGLYMCSYTHKMQSAKPEFCGIKA